MELSKEVEFCLGLIWEFSVLLPEHEGAEFQLILQSSKDTVFPPPPSFDLPCSMSAPFSYRRVQKPAPSTSLHTCGRNTHATLESCVLPSWFQDISKEKKKNKRKTSSTCRDFLLKTSKKHAICCISCTYTTVLLCNSSLSCSPVIHVEECLCAPLAGCVVAVRLELLLFSLSDQPLSPNPLMSDSL